MSENISTTSPPSPSSSADFDGASDLMASWAAGLKPDPNLTVSAWSDRNVILSGAAASEPGPYRTSRTPYLRDVMDTLSPSNAAIRVVLMAGVQLGKSQAGLNWMGACIHHFRGPFLAVQPTVQLAQRFSQQRVDPMVENSPALRDLVRPARSRDSGNTTFAKRFPGGQLVLTGANSAVGLRSMPVRWLFLDEVDAYEGDVDEEGDPIGLAEARTRTFGHRRKVFIVSTPTIKGFSRIEREYEASDQRRYFVPCPFCDHFQWLKFERLRWPDGNPDAAVYVCENCDREIAERFKTAMLGRGQWRATAVSSDPRVVGFHISGLYSPVGWLSWAQIAKEWVAAAGNEAELKRCKNVNLGETWQERGEAPDWKRLYERREPWTPGTVPTGVLILTAGADVQRDRIELDVWGWGRGLERWLIDHFVVEGSPDLAETWDRVTEIVGRSFPRSDGGAMMIARTAIDSGDGVMTARVYEWARRMGSGVAMAIKGVDGFDRSTPVDGPKYVDATQKGKKIRRGAKLWLVSIAVFKSELYRCLRLDGPTDEEIANGIAYPDGYVHVPQGANAEWMQQLTAESLVSVRDKKRGFAKLDWRKTRERNEALDMAVYARAALWVLGADRYGARFWDRLKRPEFFIDKVTMPLGADASPPPPSPPSPSLPPTNPRGPQPGRRRTIRSSFMG